MADYTSITTRTEGAVTTLALARPDKLNAITPTVFAELTAAIEAALASGTKAFVLSGEGRFFCSGADIQPDGQGYDGLPENLGPLVDAHYNPFTRLLAKLPVPVVTALNGPAAGAGVSLALSGDIVVAGRGAYLLLAFVNIGLVPDAGATWLVARSLGRARTLEMCLLGERLPAEEAKAAGLIARVVEDAEALAEAQKIAAKLASGPSRAVGAIRRQVAYALDHGLDAVLDHERDNQQEMGRTADFAEAIAAFGEKRKPVFRGE